MSSLSAPHAAPPLLPAHPLRRAAGAIDSLLGCMVEHAAAAIVLVEIAVLFAGVVARYALHSPLVWSDELASILFLWLSMLGAVVALRRGEHMRMTAFVNNVGPARRAQLETAALAASLAFLALIQVAGAGEKDKHAYDLVYGRDFTADVATETVVGSTSMTLGRNAGRWYARVCSTWSACMRSVKPSEPKKSYSSGAGAKGDTRSSASMRRASYAESASTR